MFLNKLLIAETESELRNRYSVYTLYVYLHGRVSKSIKWEDFDKNCIMNNRKGH